MPGVDGEQLSVWFDAHAAALALFARQWCVTPDDVVQESFLKLARQSEVPAEPVAWLYRVVRNGAMTASRGERRRRNREQLVAAEQRPWFVESPNREDVQLVTQALTELPLAQREVVVARIWGGLTFEQIAALTETSTSTAHRHYEQAVDALRQILEGSIR